MRRYLTVSAAACALAGAAVAQENQNAGEADAKASAQMQGEKGEAVTKDKAARTREADPAYSDEEIDGLATLVTVTTRPIIELGEYAVLSNRAHTAKRMLGAPVFNGADEEIGEVSDIAMRDGQLKTVVLATGGFLGFGGERIEVPFSRFATDYGPDAGHRLVLAATKEELEAMPTFKTTRDTSKGDVGEVFASDLLGQEIAFEAGDSSEIDSPYLDDIVLTSDGQAAFAVIEYGGVLGVGEESAVVPFSRLGVAEGDQEISLALGPRDVRLASYQPSGSSGRGRFRPR